MAIIRWSDPLTSAPWVPPVDIFQNDDKEVVLKAELPDMVREALTSRSRTARSPSRARRRSRAT